MAGSSPPNSPPPLALGDVSKLLSKLDQVETSLVLIGGQAVAFWAAHFAASAPALRMAEPLASKDTDFLGDRRAVEQAAEQLGVRPILATIDDANTPTVGVLQYADSNGHHRQIDFVDPPMGVHSEEVRQFAIPLTLLTEDGEETGTTFRVLHPIHCMESRFANTAALPGYDSPHGLAQLRASVEILREFMRQLLGSDAKDAVRQVLKLNERVFRFALKNPHALTVLAKHGVDAFDGALSDGRLPAEFRSSRYPQMQEQLRARREGARRNAEAHRRKS